MRAAALTRFGGPEAIELVEMAIPVPGDEEVLIEVRTVGVNRQDTFTMRGKAVTSPSLPHIMGIDPAGVIAAVGSGVSRLQVGQRVVVKPTVSCGVCVFCRKGEDDSCDRLSNIGVHRPGGFAEYVAVPARNAFLIPDGVDFVEATAFAHSFPVALLMLRERAGVGPGDVVLVSGAAGVIGSAAVQIAQILGARVIAAAGSPDRVKYAESLGPDLGINYGSRPDFADIVRSAFPQGVSVYVETSGNPGVWTEALKTLSRRGRVTVCGSHAGTTVELNLNWLFRARVSLIGTSGSSLATFRDTLDLAAKQRIRPNIDRMFPFSEIHAALSRLQDRSRHGKVILEIAKT